MEKVTNLSGKPFLVEKSLWRKFDDTFLRRKGTRSWEGFQHLICFLEWKTNLLTKNLNSMLRHLQCCKIVRNDNKTTYRYLGELKGIKNIAHFIHLTATEVFSIKSLTRSSCLIVNNVVDLITVELLHNVCRYYDAHILSLVYLWYDCIFVNKIDNRLLSIN